MIGPEGSGNPDIQRVAKREIWVDCVGTIVKSKSEESLQRG